MKLSLTTDEGEVIARWNVSDFIKSRTLLGIETAHEIENAVERYAQTVELEPVTD